VRILYLSPDLGIPILGSKGASAHVRGLASALSRAGHAVVVAAPILEKRPCESPARFDVPLCHIPPGEEIRWALEACRAFEADLGEPTSFPGEVRRILYNEELKSRLVRRFDRDPPDVIYERASLFSTVGAHVAAELDRPLLVEVNAPLSVEQATYRGAVLRDLAARAERAMLSQADALLVVSLPLRDHVLALGVAADRVHVVSNGVDPRLFHPGPPDPAVASRYALDGDPVVGLVGGLRPWHGLGALPSLLERLAARYPSVRLVVVGEGPLGDDLEQAIEARGLRRHAVFTGALPHDEVAGLVRGFHVALAPYESSDQPFYFSPLKLFESMACGVATVAADIGQIREVVRDGVTGFLYPPGDLEALEAACARLLDDPQLRERVGRAAAAEVAGRYTWDHNAARVVEIAAASIATRGASR
jgi:glycosyltransferase involved in cell wall biosynthesis